MFDKHFFKNILKINTFNLLAIGILLLAYLGMVIPAGSYPQATFSMFMVSFGYWFALITLVFYLIRFIIVFRRSGFKVMNISALLISALICWFTFSVFYPWGRMKIHFPPVQSVYWKEQALLRISLDFIYMLRDKDEPFPQDNWKQMLLDRGYHLTDTFESWNSTYNSSILINENIMGKRLDDFDEPVVFLFEAHKGLDFGAEEKFKQFGKDAGYVYIALTDGTAGRVRFRDGKLESLLGGLKDLQMPLKWK